MQPRSSLWLCLTSLLCLAQSSNVLLLQSKTPSYLSKYASDEYPEWRATMETSFGASQDEVGSWNVSDTNTTCILLKGILKLTINYTDTNNNTRLVNIDVPSTATASGSCSGQQHITLGWPSANSSESLNNMLIFEFQSNEKSRKVGATGSIPTGKFAISKVTAVIHKDNGTLFPNATDPDKPFDIVQEGLALFPTTLNHSFACEAVITIGSPNENLTVLMEHSRIEAFRKVAKSQTGGDKNFSTAEHCAADEISSGSVIGTVIISILSIVLIALGAAVITTYVLKKRRAANVSGYENM